MAVKAAKGLTSTVAWRYVPCVMDGASDAALRQAAWAAIPQTSRISYAKALIRVLSRHPNNPRVKALLIDPTPWGLEALQVLHATLDMKEGE